MTAATKAIKPRTLLFADDGVIPNNPSLPLVLMSNVLDFAGATNPEKVTETTFRRNGWGNIWCNGILQYVHYHLMIHEVMGIARGRAKVRFGGDKGNELDLTAGDVVIVPAGVGHQCRWADPGLVVVGAYPPNGEYNLCRSSKADHAQALKTIPHVPLPETDPVFGAHGPLVRLWQG